MVRADQRPGRRRAVPEPRRRAFRLGRGRPVRPASGRAARVVWSLLVILAAAALAVGWTPLAAPDWVPTAGAVAITTLYAFGLAYRTGGRAVISGALALGLSLGTVLSGLPVLLAGAAVGTAALAAVFAVMTTKPAAGYVTVVRECLVATLVAGIGAVAVEAFRPQVSLERSGYLVLGLSLLGALGLVFRLGAGWHGLGRRGVIMLVSGLVLLFVSLAYTEALTRWGSPALADGLDRTLRDIRAALGAVPSPIAFLIGFPALAWGVSTRARRRQGWWVSAFGAVGLAVVTVSLLDPAVSLLESGLSLLYSVLIGLALGYLVVRADTFLTGARGRRARRLEEAAAHRPEPGRMQPLL